VVVGLWKGMKNPATAGGVDIDGNDGLLDKRLQVTMGAEWDL